jgi:acetolactate synthase-1/2/3 large subunit
LDISGRSGTFDALRLFDSITRYCVRIDHVDDVPDGPAHAITATGPAVLLWPRNIQQCAIRLHPSAQPLHYEIPRVGSNLGEAQALLANAHRTGKIWNSPPMATASTGNPATGNT